MTLRLFWQVLRSRSTAVLICVGLSFVAANVNAANRPLACVVDETGGLNWEGGRWLVSKFRPDPQRFVLVMSDDTLQAESVAKAFQSSGSFECVSYLFIQCVDRAAMGRMLFFNPATMKGGLSSLFGSATVGRERDSLHVTAFSCTAF